MKLKAGRQANGRHHFGLRNARKRRALIGCVGTRGGATRVRRRAAAARDRACSVLLGFVRIGDDLRGAGLATEAQSESMRGGKNPLALF